MTIYAVQPFIDFLVEWSDVKIRRWYHRRFTYTMEKMENETHKLNVFNDYLRFLDLYAGPHYNFQYKCAAISIVITICVVLGPAMPFLYLVAVLALLVTYVLDRL
jgi:uncharacterized membrane protein YphA (DoxX/SURF4 family)